jgi:predicted PurR-regulated permease PerM
MLTGAERETEGGEAGEQASEKPVSASDVSSEGAAEGRGGSSRGESIALKGLFILALIHTLYFGRSFLLPIFVALIGMFLLSPAVRWSKSKLRLPEGVSAAGILLLIGLLAAYTAVSLRYPLVNWLNDAPTVIAEAQEKLQGPIKAVREATKRLEAATGDAKGVEPTPVVAVRETGPGWGETLVAWLPSMIGYAVVTVILLFFFLTYGELFLLKVVKVMPTFSDKKNAVEIAHMIERQTSSYLATITMINMGLGTVVGVAMALWGLPNPVLWGMMAAVLNFVPYLGALIGVTVVALVALTQFDGAAYALLVPLTYYILTASEGFLVTPILLGRRLILNPVVIFLGLVFWGWLWGIPGMLLAVPLLAIFKIFCDQIKPLESVGEFMGR